MVHTIRAGGQEYVVRINGRPLRASVGVEIEINYPTDIIEVECLGRKMLAPNLTRPTVTVTVSSPPAVRFEDCRFDFLYNSESGNYIDVYIPKEREPDLDGLLASRADALRYQLGHEERVRRFYARIDEAKVRAKALLLTHLDAAQRAEFEADEQFTVVSEHGRRFRILKDTVSNVHEVNELGNVVARYCLVLEDGVPVHDLMLAQKLLLETNEAYFMRLANVNRPYGIGETWRDSTSTTEWRIRPVNAVSLGEGLYTYQVET